MPVTRPLLAASLAGLMAAILAPAVHAQVYRITGPDGRVTFSDKPPPEPSAKNAAAAPTVPMQGAGSGNATAALPFELRQVAAKYPVTLYTGPNCGPCGSGRALLASRGIPFSEKLVASNEDIDALKRLSVVAIPGCRGLSQDIAAALLLPPAGSLAAGGCAATGTSSGRASRTAASPGACGRAAGRCWPLPQQPHRHPLLSRRPAQ